MSTPRSGFVDSGRIGQNRLRSLSAATATPAVHLEPDPHDPGEKQRIAHAAGLRAEAWRVAENARIVEETCACAS